ncbi:MAG: SDR family NAD(P)-dependent oxidoreductase, partial [Actinomycetota bacterium]
MDLNGAHVVVTGGSTGIGAALADEFTERGARVLVVARSEEKLRTVAARNVGDYVVADLSDAGDVDGLVEKCLATLGHVDVWVNNAGIETSTSFASTPRDEIRTLARLNFEATLLLTRDVLDHLLPRNSGHVDVPPVRRARDAGMVMLDLRRDHHAEALPGRVPTTCDRAAGGRSQGC